ncbi:beta,beta-carotene 9',10'-dioxygenase [Sarotherodon galilaeus]
MGRIGSKKSDLMRFRLQCERCRFEPRLRQSRSPTGCLLVVVGGASAPQDSCGYSVACHHQCVNLNEEDGKRERKERLYKNRKNEGADSETRGVQSPAGPFLIGPQGELLLIKAVAPPKRTITEEIYPKLLNMAEPKKRKVERKGSNSSYEVAQLIARHGEPFSDGDLIKHGLVKVTEIMCLETVQDFNNVSMSRNTVVRRIEDSPANIKLQLSDKAVLLIFTPSHAIRALMPQTPHSC